MPTAVLITQCLQTDFIGLVEAHDPLPNPLHVGRQEAVRLLGREPEYGPVAQLMSWARAQDVDRLEVLHVRDWHDPSDPTQASHLERFGLHCIADTAGAELVLDLAEQVETAPNEHFINSTTLNDFDGTDLQQVLEKIREESIDGVLRVGVVGVWTEAKVTFLLYELQTRCGIDRLSTCSALTASSSRSQHFNALHQLQGILGVEVFDSVGEFTSWLVPDGTSPVLPQSAAGFGPRIVSPGAEDLRLEPSDSALLAHLFRDSVEVELSELGGGFSGARVFSVRSTDALGQEQAPSVVKIGSRALIGAERAAFERVEEVLGNAAPSVLGFTEFGTRAGLKYAYAAMGRGDVQTFQELFESGEPMPAVEEILNAIFGEVLGRFYRAAQYERLSLLEHYDFAPKWADSVERKVGQIVDDSSVPRLAFPGGYEVDNVVGFYRDFLARHESTDDEFHYVSYVHGDLNGANALIDGRRNVWIIDFFHTARSHVLKDLAKLENDMLYIFTKLQSESELREALLITRVLRAVEDLRAPLPVELEGLKSPHLMRAWMGVRLLRGHVARLCQSDRHPLQMSVALLRYAAHTLSFEESSLHQRRWALAAACGHAEDVQAAYDRSLKLWVDWLPQSTLGGQGRCGLTICPGRADRGRELAQDLDDLVSAGTTRVVALLSAAEMEWAGVSQLGREVRARGMKFEHLPIQDQDCPELAEAQELCALLRAAIDQGEVVVLHCMGGLGRSGLIAASLLVDAGLSASAAISEVREARDPRAVETQKQEDFVSRYAEVRGARGTDSPSVDHSSPDAVPEEQRSHLPS